MEQYGTFVNILWQMLWIVPMLKGKRSLLLVGVCVEHAGAHLMINFTLETGMAQLQYYCSSCCAIMFNQIFTRCRSCAPAVLTDACLSIELAHKTWRCNGYHSLSPSRASVSVDAES
jgi:hypothetical protein